MLNSIYLNEKSLDELKRKPFIHYIKAYPKPFCLGLLVLFITNGFDAIWPILLKKVLDGIQNHYSPSQLSLSFFLFFFVMSSLAITRFYWRSIFSRFYFEVQEALRGTLWNKVVTLSQNYFQKTPIGEIMSHLVQDVQSFRQGIGPGLLILFDGITIILMVIPLMIYLNPIWTFKTLSLLPFIPLIIWRLNLKIQKIYKIQQDRFAELTSFCQESVLGIKVIKSFVQEQNRFDQFQKLSREFLKDSEKLSFYESLFHPCMELGVSAAAILLIYIAQNDMLTGAATVGTFLAFHRYLSKLMWPLTAIGLGSTYIQKSKASFDRIKKILNEESFEVESEEDLELKNWNTIRFVNVSFVYPGATQKSLDQVNFEIRRGEFLAIIGSVGSGKSTIIQLLLRIYKITEGKILIDDVPIESYSLQSLRFHFTLIPQEAFLMSDTILNNLKYGREDLNYEESYNLLKKVQLYSEVQNLQMGVDSFLGEKGVNLSGGQKQRMTLARGLARHSSLLILDDVLSAVDVNTEEALLNIIKNESDRQTLILITHRLSGLKHVNRVLVLEQGKVIECGEKESIEGLINRIQHESELDKNQMNEIKSQK